MSTSKKIWFGALAVLFLGLFLNAPSCAIAPTTDHDITLWVKDALRNDERVKADAISVSTKDGIVTLSGTVQDMAAKTYADMETKKIDGVVGVINEIIVSPVYKSDEEIITQVTRRILNSPLIESKGLQVTSQHGDVSLSGAVTSWAEKEQAGLLASEVRGVRNVQNDLAIDWLTARSDLEIKNDALSVLHKDVYLAGLPITVMVQDGMVTLTGAVGSSYQKDRATNDLHWIANVKDIDNRVVVKSSLDRGVRRDAAFPTDHALKNAVQEALDQDTRLTDSNVNIRVSSGHVELDGSVHTHHQRQIAQEDAADVVGVAWVTNNLLTVPEKRDDTMIKDDVDFNLLTDFLLENQNLKSDVHSGVVTLSGNVPTWYQKIHAEDVAARVKGVNKVNNRIVVDEKRAKTDQDLAKDIENRLNWNWVTDLVAKDINVKVRDGVAILGGDVNSWAERREAGRVAFMTQQVWKVDNRITVHGYDYPWDEYHYKDPYAYNPLYDPYESLYGYEYPWELY